MSREAIVQGEVHAAETDAREVLNRLEDYDAVLVEGRQPTIVVERLTVGYAAFLMGYVSLMWIQSLVARSRDRAGGRSDLRAAAEAAGVDYHDRIDADTATAYAMAPAWGKRLLGALLVAFLAAGVVVGVNRLVLVGLSLSLPYLYTTLTVVLVKVASGGRATYMADAITALAEDRSYDRVAVLCGDAHREDVGAALRRREWSVETHPSTHPLRRPFG